MVVETLVAILDELKTLNKDGDSDDEGLIHCPIESVEELENASTELEQRPGLKRSLVNLTMM